ncbi:MAG TPA: hypothetical protein VIO58_01620 [Candidatus Methanoperedens sp.]
MSLKSEKAEVEVIGHIIILGLTITGIAMITLVGVPSIYNMQEMAKVRNIEQAYTVFDSRASKVALGSTPLQVVNIDAGGGSISVVSNPEPGDPSSDEGYITFALKNGTGTVVNISIPMGKIVYRIGDREVAYEGGGVFSKYPEGSVMLSPPEFNYNGITLTFPVVNISGNSSISGKGTASLKFEKIGEAMIYPNATYQNPISENVTDVVITIKSEYYDAWADYFQSVSLVKVDTIPDEKKVTVTLVTPPPITNFTYGALASDEIEIDKHGEIDSYNSTNGPYSSTKSGNGSIYASKKIEIDKFAIVNGSALTGGDITGEGTIKKDAYAKSFGAVTVVGNKSSAVTGISLRSVTNLVQSRINEYKATNDNIDSACLDGPGNATLDGTASGWISDTCTMFGGIGGKYYYIDFFDIPNNNILKFDTTSGPINIAAETTLNFSQNSNITIIGNNPVRIYLNKPIDIRNLVEINNNNNGKSSLFQIISSDPQDININNNAFFYGFIWSTEAEIHIKQNAQVYGAMVGKKFDLEENQKMHFDEALKNLNTDIGAGTTVMYMYITRNDVVATLS